MACFYTIKYCDIPLFRASSLLSGNAFQITVEI